MRWFLLLLLLPMNAWAGAWLQDEGKGQVITNFTYYSAVQQFDKSGDIHSMPDYNKYEVSPYAEYGLTDYLTIGGSFSYKAVDNETQTKTYYDSDDYNIFARTYLYKQGNMVVSTEANLYLPRKTGGELNPESGVAPTLKINFGYGEKDYFIDLSAGYQYWANHESDRIRSAATVGLNLTDDWMWMNQVFSNNITHSDYNQAANFDLTTAQTSLVWKYDDSVNFQVGISRDIYGRNTGCGTGILSSVWYKF